MIVAMGILENASVFSAAVDVLRFPPTAFPKGKPIQKNLDTHYIDLEALFRSLAGEGFFGTVLMVFEEGTESLIVFREGTIITAYSDSGRERRTGMRALSQTLGLTKTVRAYVDVFKLEHEILVAILPLLHGVQIPVKGGDQGLEATLAEFQKAEFVGAVVAGDNVPEAVGLIYGGIPMGWYDAQGLENDTGAAPPRVRSQTVHAFALDNADTFAAINLGQDKLNVAGKVRDVLFGELKELGLVLYVRALERASISDERLASKSQFMGLVQDFERATATLRGPVHAMRIRSELRQVVDAMIDVGF